MWIIGTVILVSAGVLLLVAGTGRRLLHLVHSSGTFRALLAAVRREGGWVLLHQCSTCDRVAGVSSRAIRHTSGV